MSTVKTKRHLLRNILCTVLTFAGFWCFFSARWFVGVYGRIGFDSILYTLTSSLGGVESALLIQYSLKALLPCLACTGIWIYLAFFCPRPKFLKAKNGVAATVLTLVLALALIWAAAVDSEFDEYVVAQFSDTPLYETYYVDPDSVSVTFPDNKRNLIYIMLESMETSYLSQDQGGAMEEDLIPELAFLAEEYTCFSHSQNAVGGYHTTSGATWTIGSMVAQTAGIPLKTPTEDVNQYGRSGEEFLPGATTLLDILADAGYNQALMVGSYVAFGGREAYYSQHGVEEIYDVYSAQDEGIIPEDYFVWWGMEDLYLFRYAKEKITDLASREEPFAFTMLTVDTHHVGGYQCQLCQESASGESYDQSISCSSRQVLEFVNWVQQQDFYENTTIVIVGDHESMDNGYFERMVDPDYQRMIYNCFINADAFTTRVNNRQWTAHDLFPTTLAAIGAEIEGDRLGLGTNLFSNQITLCEKYGFEAYNQELAKASEFYIQNFH